MESVASMSADITLLESQLESITLQNKLEDIITIINNYQEQNESKQRKKRSRKPNKKQDSPDELESLIQESIQRQIKKYIEVIESNLKKYWYTDMESKLYAFLSDLKINWEFFEPFFNVDESLDVLEGSVHAYILDLKKQRSQIEIDELLEKISNTFEYWPSQKAHRCLELAEFLDQKEEIEQSLIDIQKTLINYNIENSADSNTLKTLEKKFPLLVDNEKNKDLVPLLKERIAVLEKNEYNSQINSNLEVLEETIVRGGFWDQSIESKIIKDIQNIDPVDAIEFFKRMIQLIHLYYSEKQNSNSIYDLYPELQFQGKMASINITYEGIWSLQVFYKGAWYPGYRLKDQPDFAQVEFNQDGEWKNRKFKCFSWSLIGKMPLGAIIKLINKKERVYLIITHQNLAHIRDINLTEIDENVIKNLSQDTKDTSKIPTFDKDDEHERNMLENLIQSDALYIKIALKMLSVDKNRVAKVSTILQGIVEEKGLEIQSKLDKTKDKKFIAYIDKFIPR